MAAYDRIVVGTYTTKALAQQAAEYLAGMDVGEIQTREVTDGVFQISVPWRHAHEALTELQRHEQWAIDSH